MRDNRMSFMFVFSVLLIYPLPQMTIDIYLPSWPAMLVGLNTSKFLLQMSLTVYIVFLGIAQLIYGPLSDRFGRKRMLLVGIAIFFVSSLACQYATSISQLLVFRALQGLGIGCGFTIASSILADVFHGPQLAKMTSYSAMIYSLSLILAPVAGGYLQHYIGWHANFAAMSIYALVLFVLILLFVFETRSDSEQEPVAISKIAANYYQLFFNLPFVGFVLCLIFAYGLMVAFSIIGPFLLQQDLGVSAVNYGRLVFLVGIAYFLGSMVNSKLVTIFGSDKLIIFGFLLKLCSGVGLLALAWTGHVSIASVVIFVSLGIFSIGFVYPNCFARSLDACAKKGYASGFAGSATLLGVAVVSVLVSHCNLHHGLCLSLSFTILALLAISSYFATRNRELSDVE